MGANIEIILVGIMVCACCALPGTFLVLRGMSMMTDAISHTVLLGIVLGFFASDGNISSPIVVIFAILTGLLTVWLTELLHSTKLVNKGSAIGIVFPFLFATAVILIAKFAKNVHLDVEHIIFGDITFVPFERFETVNYDFGPKSLVILSIIFIINLTIISLFYKEFKVSTFDSEYAKVIGISITFMNYLLMSLVSVTSFGAFQAVGVIVVIAFMVGPALTARLLTDKLGNMLILSIVIGTIDSLVGYFLAIYFDVSISGMQAFIIGLIFFVVLLITKRKNLFKAKKTVVSNN